MEVTHNRRWLQFGFSLSATVLLLVSPLILGSPLTAAPGFSFHRFTSLKQGERFSILLRDSSGSLVKSGSGKILILTSRDLKFEFSMSASGIPVSGYIHATVKDGNDSEGIHLISSGSVAGKKEGADEVVHADSFLAENGILTFEYMKGRRFFQFSLTPAGVNRLVTDWGAATLVKE